jgi:probable F420-dependent oxidoreductase
MKIGVGYPQFHGGVDTGAVRAFAQGAEELGYDYILVSDHVIGVELSQDNDWDGGAAVPVFRDPFVFCAFMAGATRKIGFSTCVTVVSQRQTVLMARQIADLDELSGGRFRFGIGTGWCKPEYEAMGANFATRGQMMEEQIELLRDLWTQPKVSRHTPFHTLTDISLRPLPQQRPVPIWIGGADAHSTDEHRAHVARFHEYCREYGRDPSNVGIEAFVALSRKNQDTWADQLKVWRDFGGVTHVGVSGVTDNIMGVDGNLKILEDFRQCI